MKKTTVIVTECRKCPHSEKEDTYCWTVVCMHPKWKRADGTMGFGHQIPADIETRAQPIPADCPLEDA